MHSLENSIAVCWHPSVFLRLATCLFRVSSGLSSSPHWRNTLTGNVNFPNPDSGTLTFSIKVKLYWITYSGKTSEWMHGNVIHSVSTVDGLQGAMNYSRRGNYRGETGQSLRMELMPAVKGESMHVETKIPSSQTVASAVRKKCCKRQESLQGSGDLGNVCRGEAAVLTSTWAMKTSQPWASTRQRTFQTSGRAMAKGDS